MEDYLDELNPYTGEASEDENGEDLLLNSIGELESAPELLETQTETIISAPHDGLLSSEALADDLEIGGDVGSLPL